MRHVLESWWLPFLDTYRTICVEPPPEFQRLFEKVRVLCFAG
jgi:hypothetical protein